MACLAHHQGICRYDLRNELLLPRARLLHSDYALVPLNHSQRARSDRPLAHHIADDSALDARCGLRHRSLLGGVADSAVIDRIGPFGGSTCSPRCRSLPHLYDDAEYLDVPEHWQFSHTYPLQCKESGGIGRSPDQIQAYNRDVLRHNNQIARRRNVGVPGEYMMLHPMMDPLGRFAPGFDRPMPFDHFLAMDEPSLDSHRHHYSLPQPENLERLLILSSAEHHLRRQLKQIQLLDAYGARHLAEQYAIQLLAVQNALPGLGAPRCLGSGLGADFDDSYLGPLRREYAGMMPLAAIGYGSGLANWDFDKLAQLSAAKAAGRGRGLGPCWGGLDSAIPWAGAAMYPGMDLNRGYSSPAGWLGVPHGAGPWGGHMGGYDPRRMSMGMGEGGRSGNLDRIIEAISCDGGGGGGGRRGRGFNN